MKLTLRERHCIESLKLMGQQLVRKWCQDFVVFYFQIWFIHSCKIPGLLSVLQTLLLYYPHRCIVYCENLQMGPVKYISPALVVDQCCHVLKSGWVLLSCSCAAWCYLAHIIDSVYLTLLIVILLPGKWSRLQCLALKAGTYFCYSAISVCLPVLCVCVCVCWRWLC